MESPPSKAAGQQQSPATGEKTKGAQNCEQVSLEQPTAKRLRGKTAIELEQRDIELLERVLNAQTLTAVSPPTKARIAGQLAESLPKTRRQELATAWKVPGPQGVQMVEPGKSAELPRSQG